jgi:hypothetical protein
VSQVEQQDQADGEVEVLDIDPGHVRALAHYQAMLAEAGAEAKEQQQ